MPLSEDEELELELLELERERAGISSATPSISDKEPTLGEKIGNTWNDINAAASDNSKTPTAIEKMASIVGRTLAFPAAAGMTAAQYAYNKISPGDAEEDARFKKEIVQPVLEAAKPVTRAVANFTENHPRLTTDLESAMNIGGAAAGAAGMMKSGMIPKMGKVAGEALDKGAARIQGTKVKINAPEFKKGAQNEMYTKHEVFGNAEGVRGQWQKKIDDTYNQVKEKIENSRTAADPKNYTFVQDIFDAAEKAAEKYGKTPTDILSVKKSIKSFRDLYDEAFPDGKIDLLTAQAEKQAAGHKGDWYSVAGQVKTDPALSAQGKAYNALYDAFKNVVESKGEPGIKELNKKLSEFIPMERAARKQVLVNSRKNLIPLDAFIGGLHSVTSAAHGNIVPALLTAATLGTRSPLVAKGLHGSAKGLKYVSTKKVR
jgi:hypothetical protein